MGFKGVIQGARPGQWGPQQSGASGFTCLNFLKLSYCNTRLSDEIASHFAWFRCRPSFSASLSTNSTSPPTTNSSPPRDRSSIYSPVSYPKRASSEPAAEASKRESDQGGHPVVAPSKTATRNFQISAPKLHRKRDGSMRPTLAERHTEREAFDLYACY